MTGLPEALSFDRPPVPGAIEAENLFTQVCGYPLQTTFRGQARLLGVPTYAVPHCAPGRHAAVFIVHADAPYRPGGSEGRDIRLQQPTFQFGHEPAAPGPGADRRAGSFGSITETHSHPKPISSASPGVRRMRPAWTMSPRLHRAPPPLRPAPPARASWRRRRRRPPSPSSPPSPPPSRSSPPSRPRCSRGPGVALGRGRGRSADRGHPCRPSMRITRNSCASRPRRRRWAIRSFARAGSVRKGSLHKT